MKLVFDAAMKNGLNLWDTALAYGMGTSEKMLGGLIAGLDRDSYIISDKFTPQRADYGVADPVGDMLKTELGFLGIENMDIYWLHNTVDAVKWITAIAEYFEGKDLKAKRTFPCWAFQTTISRKLSRLTRF